MSRKNKKIAQYERALATAERQTVKLVWARFAKLGIPCNSLVSEMRDAFAQGTPPSRRRLTAVLPLRSTTTTTTTTRKEKGRLTTTTTPPAMLKTLLRRRPWTASSSNFFPS